MHDLTAKGAVDGGVAEAEDSHQDEKSPGDATFAMIEAEVASSQDDVVGGKVDDRGGEAEDKMDGLPAGAGQEQVAITPLAAETVDAAATDNVEERNDGEKSEPGDFRSGKIAAEAEKDGFDGRSDVGQHV